MWVCVGGAKAGAGSWDRVGEFSLSWSARWRVRVWLGMWVCSEGSEYRLARGSGRELCEGKMRGGV